MRNGVVVSHTVSSFFPWQGEVMPSHPSTSSQLLEWAFFYFDMGWSILPTVGKKPVCNWKEHQTQRLSKTRLVEMLRLKRITGLAVILGSASQGLTCRDFDVVDSYTKWTQKQVQLSKTLPTVRTGNGFHVYFRGVEGFRKDRDGEYRGRKGQITVLPPSKHPSGRKYEWIVPVPKNGALPEVNPFECGLFSQVGKPLNIQTALPIGCSLYGVVDDVDDSVGTTIGADRDDGIVISRPEQKYREYYLPDEIRLFDLWISRTLPTEVGQRHERLFEFCRKLKSVPKFTKLNVEQFKPAVWEWYHRCFPVIGTKDFTPTWKDFQDAWRTFNLIELPLDMTCNRAREAEPPERVAIHYRDRPRMVLLCNLCKELQGEGEQFFLASAEAGRVLGVNQKTALKMLDNLVKDGFLNVVEIGSHKERRATVYRWIS